MSTYDLCLCDPAVRELLKAIELAKSSGANPELIETLESTLELTRLRDNFAHASSSKESETLKKILQETYKHDWEAVHQQGKSFWKLDPEMMSGTLEGQFLKSVVSIQKAKRILDIGLFTGYSALSMAEALPDDGQVVSIEVDEYLKNFVTDLTKSSPHSKKIKIINGKALDVLKNLAADGEKFDIIYLDADKDEYIDYLKYAFDGGLLNPGGTVLVDNAFFFGDGYIPSRGDTGPKRFANYISTNPTLHKVLVPIRDGIFVIRKLADVEHDTE